MIIPVMCIAAGIWMESIRKYGIIKKKSVYVGIVSGVLIFGFTSTTLLIINDISLNQFNALSYVLKNYDDDVTILASPVYSAASATLSVASRPRNPPDWCCQSLA